MGHSKRRSTVPIRAMASMTDDLAADLATIMSATLGQAARITNLKRLTGGTSHDSWAFDAETSGVVHPLIVRRDFSAERLDLELKSEVALLQHLYKAGLPVPKPVTSGKDYIISERLTGGDIRKRMARGVDEPAALGAALVAMQAQLHKFDWQETLSGVPAPRDEVDHWANAALQCASGPDPLLAATIAWLKRNTPADTPLCLVHGDFKANNLVIDDETRFAIIDWELAHIGDPLEDIAWTMLWRTPHDLVGGMLSPGAYLAAYQRAAGTRIDHHRLAYWQMFALIKLMAIFSKSMRLHGKTAHPRPSHIMLDRAIPWLHLQMAERLRSGLAA
jgi:aminoglycoside phosphotransferase (APT) family kinase protein